MISTKLKEDAAKINSEIKKITTKIPLTFLNYTYHNEDTTVVLKRRNDQLDEMQDVKEFLNNNNTFSEVLRNCQADFKDVKEQLKRFEVDMNVLDDASRNCSNNTLAKDHLTVGPWTNSNGVMHTSRIPRP
ncbi:hypothetical protein HA402_006239 [Bradysia odoriphaga]|nr:hypothetical protein HA402_006239 [Bradysia odoriphaga]